jgi:Carbonic anhydrases/acetyltransferases, isoleucine patch superfamily
MSYDELLEILKEKEENMRVNFQRTLPRHELLNDRWEKAQLLGFGKNSNIYDSSYVFGEVKVGEKTWIGPYTLLDGTGGLSIGAYCNISAGVQIYTHSSLNWVLTRGNANYVHESTEIGDCVYIGSQSIIDKGVKIGAHSVIAANSYVNKSFSDYSIIAGTPASLIGKVVVEENNEISFCFNENEISE